MYRIFFFLFLCTQYSLSAQIPLDSLSSIDSMQYYLGIIDESVEENKFDKVARNYEQFAQYLLTQNNKDEALKAYTKSIQFYGILDDSLNYYRINIELANYYESSKLYQDALDINEQALLYFQRENDYNYQLYLCKKISDIYRIQRFPEKERYFLERSLKINRFVKDTLFEIGALLQKTRIMENLDEIDKAMASVRRAANLSIAVSDTTSLSHAYIRLGIINHKLKKNNAALKYLEQGDSLFQLKPYSFPHYTDYKKISDSFIAFDEAQKAYSYLSIYVAQQDSSTTIEQQNAINEIMASYQKEKQEREIKDLQEEKVSADIKAQQQRTIIYSFLFGLLVILVGLYYTIRFYQQRIAAREIIATQKEEINRQRIVDLENNLKIETMQSMLAGQEAERERVAKDLHDSLGGLLSTIKLQFESVETKVNVVSNVREYQKANLMLDEACQEVRNISNNMQPGALVKLGLVPALKDLINRFQDDHYPEIFFQPYGLENKLDNTTALMVFRIIQELLNNSIKYAKAEEILVQLTRNEDELIIMVEDDGVGYDMENVKKGMGTENINSRVNYLKGDMSIHSVISKGTSTMINVPL